MKRRSPSALAELGVRPQRVDAAIDVDRRVVLDRAAVGGGDLVVRVAVRLQHLDDGCQQAGALAVAQRAQRAAALFAGEAEAGRQVETGRVDADQFGAEHRIEQRRAGAAAGHPAAADEVGEQFGHGIWLTA